MKKEALYTVIIILVVLLGIVLWARPSGGTATAASGGSHPAIRSSLSVSESLYDFGTISMKNGNVDHLFTIKNASDKDVNINRILTSCMCTSAYVVEEDGSEVGPFGMAGHGGAFLNSANETIKAGGSKTIRVVFNPNAHGPAGVGYIQRTITLGDAAGGSLKFEIKAVVTP